MRLFNAGAGDGVGGVACAGGVGAGCAGGDDGARDCWVNYRKLQLPSVC